MYQYYVQEIANNYLKNLAGPPAGFKVHKAFLHGVEEEDFQSGFLELHSVIQMIYTDLIRNPREFGMMLREYVTPDAKNTEYTQSHASFVRLPNLLFLLGYLGVLQPDITLAVGGADLVKAAKELKITKTQELLKKLGDYGFEIEGMPKTLQPGDSLIIGYPQNRFLITALKSIAEAMGAVSKGDLRKSKNHFYMLNHRLLESDKPKEPRLTVDNVYHALGRNERKVAESLNDFIVKHAKPSVRMGGFSRNDWSCVYNLLSSKKVLMTLNVGQDHLSVKLNLANIGRYIEKVNQYPERIREAITSGGWECGHCHGSCAGGFAFGYEGKSYNKCRCGSFVFNNIDEETVKCCLELLEHEIASQ